MWDDGYATLCRRHADLVAVFEAPAFGQMVESDGVRRRATLALLLRHTVVPLVEERGAWLADTRRAARAVIADLRAAGVPGAFVVLQWCPLVEVSRVLSGWACRYEADAGRRAELMRVVGRRVADLQFVAGSRAAEARPITPARAVLVRLPGASDLVRPASFLEWYRGMTLCWLSARPPLRRRLILATHRWILRHVLLPSLGDGAAPGAAMPGEDGLEFTLMGTIPPAERGFWRPWVRLVAADVRSALTRSPARRDETWVKWLFLIPYSVPLSARPMGPAGPAGPLRWGGLESTPARRLRPARDR